MAIVPPLIKNISTMNKSILLKENLNLWLGMYPDSGHPCDDARYFDTIKYAYKNNLLDLLLTIDLPELVKENQPDWGDDYIDEFVKEWEIVLEKCVLLLKSMQEDGTIPNYCQE